LTTGPPVIDLNADLGESFGAWRLGDDDALLSIVTSANIACGFHAGDPLTLRRACAAAAARGVSIGAQVSYRDLAGFGRREMDVPPAELAAEILYQIAALDGIARTAGSRVRYVKPHGALYHRVTRDPVQAAALASAIADYDPALPLLTLASDPAAGPAAAGRPAPSPTETGRQDPVRGSTPGPARSGGAARPAAPGGAATSPAAAGGAGRQAGGAGRQAGGAGGQAGCAAAAAAVSAGLAVVAEAFADRAYRADGSLVPRGEPGAVLTNPDQVAARAVAMVISGGVESAAGTRVALGFRSLCIHGDTPGAVSLARSVRRALAEAGIRLAPFA
jgi:5-oxoprolinase (ATP-hydrolysing) subunit A